MEPKPKRSTLLEVHVPQDVIFDRILPRIPAKSGCRFRCISKEWHSFLTSDTFRNKYNDSHIDDHENNLKLLVLSKTETSFEFTTIECEAPPIDKQGLTPTRRPLPLFGHTTTPHHIHLLASFHGLVCLGIIKDKGDALSDLILWNPLTNEYKRLSTSTPLMNGCIRYSSSIFGLYYSCCEDDYKFLFVNLTDDNVYIYSLKLDSWRKAADVFQHTSRLNPETVSPDTYLHENLYFLQHHPNGLLSSVIRFDTKTERFSKIKTPNVDDIPNAYKYYDTIMVKSDCIHVCVRYERSGDNGSRRTTCIKLWKLDEYENMKEVLTCQLLPYSYDHLTISSLRPLHLMKNGNWLMMLKHCWSSYNDGIYKVDLKKKICITNKGKENIDDDFGYAKVRMDKYTNMIQLVGVEVRYIETFVSPNRYKK